MKTVAIILMFFCVNAFAASKSKPGYSVETEFQFKSEERKATSKNTVVVAEENRDWILISGSSKGIELSARIVKVENETIQMEYKVIDHTQNEKVLSNPSIIAKLGRVAEIENESEGKNEKIKIKMLASQNAPKQSAKKEAGN
jgi:hypothetical protein